MARAEWQKVVFAGQPRQSDLLELAGAGLAGTPVRINVHRNQPFELIGAYAVPFFRYAGWEPDFVYSAYDDSLGFLRHREAHAEFIWLDYRRYLRAGNADEVAAWLRQRVEHLRGLTAAPILIANAAAGPEDLGAEDLNQGLQGIAAGLPGVRACDQTAIRRTLGARYTDDRSTALAAIDLSAEACVETARRLAFLWAAPVLGPRIKAVAVDLDNTLYAGVLGEDGPEGLWLTPAHAELQTALARLQESGVLLALVSRNEPADVEALFARRTDFPLERRHFSAVHVSWLRKSEGIRKIAAELRIGLDSILFLDDNAGELAEAGAAIPELALVHAADPAGSLRALQLYPGLHGYPAGEADQRRAFDLEAAGRRAREQATAGDAGEYLASLHVELELALNPAGDCARLQELSAKTNQFNTGFLRLSEAQVAQRLVSTEYSTVSIRLRDRLSDSGLVGAIFARWDGADLHLEEIAISCRALGRELEDAMVQQALAGMARARHTLHPAPALNAALKDVLFYYHAGPRNTPAREWLRRFTGVEPVSGRPIRAALAGLAAHARPARVLTTWNQT